MALNSLSLRINIYDNKKWYLIFSSYMFFSVKTQFNQCIFQSKYLRSEHTKYLSAYLNFIYFNIFLTLMEHRNKFICLSGRK